MRSAPSRSTPSSHSLHALPPLLPVSMTAATAHSSRAALNPPTWSASGWVRITRSMERTP